MQGPTRAETSPELESEPALLLLLDGLVRRDGATSGLNGEVCVGVRGADGYRWWRARFGRRFECGFINNVSTTAHATLCIGEADADHFLRAGRLPASPDLFMLDGKEELFRAFVKRYTTRTGWLGIRLHK